MRVLFLAADTRAKGGIQAYNKKFIAALKSLGVDVRVIELRGLDVLSKARFALSFIWRSLFSRPDLTICTNINFSPLVLAAKKFLRIPYSITVYGIEVAEIGSGIFKSALRQARVIVHLFDQARRDVTRQVPETATKIIAISNSVNGDRFFIRPPAEATLNKYELHGARVVLTVSRLDRDDAEGKGYLRVLRALPDIHKEFPKLKYVLAGDGNDVSRIRELVRELGLEKAVVLPGAISDAELLDLYNCADVLVLPSKNEGFPAIVLLESLACGTPVIGGDQPDSENDFWRREAGTIVPADDVAAIGSAIRNFLSGSVPAHLKDREYLRKKVLEAYGPERYIEQVKAFLTKVQ